MGQESRRSARVATKLLVAVEGVDAEPTPRTGDISSTGIYFESEADIGEVGTVQWLHLRSADRARDIHLMAHVVRSVSLKEIARPRLGGVALEFMPENDERIAQLQDFVRYVLGLEEEGDGAFIAPRLDARAALASGLTQGATLKRLSVSALSLEARWSVPIGETMRVEIIAPGVPKPIRLRGKAVNVVPTSERTSGELDGQYHIEVEFQEEDEGPLRRQSSMSALRAARPLAVHPEEAPLPPLSNTPLTPTPPPAASAYEGTDDDYVSRTLEGLLASLIVPTKDKHDDAPSRRAHLSGLLARVRLPTLAALFEMERLEGELCLTHQGEIARVFVRGGRIVDVESASQDPRPRPQLARLFGWAEGTFEFIVRPVDRADRVELSTTALLLDLAREADEMAREVDEASRS